LVGICSYLLIGFYYERTSASNAANKAFITNRVGDAGFIIGLLILWTYMGTLNFEEIFHQLRAPVKHSHGPATLAGQIVRGTPAERTPEQLARDRDFGILRLSITPPEDRPSSNSYAVLFPRQIPGHFHAPGFDEEAHEMSEISTRATP